MKIQITASHRECHKGVYTPDTLWLSEKPTAVTVLDADESPVRAKGVAFDGMEIGRNELASLRKTNWLMVQGMDQSNAVEMTAQLAEAHGKHADEIARLQGINDEQGREIVRLKAFESRCIEQEATIAALRASTMQRGQPQAKQQSAQR